MKDVRTVPFLTAVIACGLLIANVRADEENDVDPVLETQHVSESCVLKITWEDDASSLSPEVIEALLRSSGVWGAALESAFGADLPRVRDEAMLHLETLNVSTMQLAKGEFMKTLVGRLTLEIQGEGSRIIKGNAKPTFQKICSLLHESILEFGESTIISHHQMRQNYREQSEHARIALHKILTERRAFLEQTMAVELDEERLTHELRRLQDKKAELEMDRTVAHARRDAMQEQISRLSASAKVEPIQRDDIEQLRAIVAIRQDALEKGEDQVQRGLISAHELHSLQVEAAQAAADFARAQVDAQREHDARMHELGGAFIIEMNHELTRMAIDEADMQAKYKATLERMEQVRQSLKIAEEYGHIGGDRLELARERLEFVQHNLAKIEHRVATSHRPTMTIIGANKL